MEKADPAIWIIGSALIVVLGAVVAILANWVGHQISKMDVRQEDYEREASAQRETMAKDLATAQTRRDKEHAEIHEHIAAAITRLDESQRTNERRFMEVKSDFVERFAEIRTDFGVRLDKIESKIDKVYDLLTHNHNV